MADADLCTMHGEFRERNPRKNKKGCYDSIPFIFGESAQMLVASTAQCVTASNHPGFFRRDYLNA
jgi:hypothetical protein